MDFKVKFILINKNNLKCLLIFKQRQNKLLGYSVLNRITCIVDAKVGILVRLPET